MSRHTVRLTQTGRLCLIGHSEGVPPDLCCHTNYQSASARTLHWHRGIAALSEAEPGPAGWARELSVANRHFFFCASTAPRATGDGCGPRPSRSSRADRAVALCYQADGSGITRQPRPPRCSRGKCGVAVQPGHGGQH